MAAAEGLPQELVRYVVSGGVILLVVVMLKLNASLKSSVAFSVSTMVQVMMLP